MRIYRYLKYRLCLCVLCGCAFAVSCADSEVGSDVDSESVSRYTTGDVPHYTSGELYGSESLEVVIPFALTPDMPSLVRDVACPEVVKRKAGSSVVCSAVIDGVEVDVTVNVGDRDRVDLVADGFFLVSLAELETDVADKVSTDFGTVEVLCDEQPVFMAVAGRTVACRAIETNGSLHPISVVITSEQGDWQVRLR